MKKNVLIVSMFILALSLGIFLDSLLVSWIVSFFVRASLLTLATVKVVSWIVLSFFTGGPIFAIAFIFSGAVKTSLE